MTGWRAKGATLAISLLGVGVFHVLHLPLPFLLGPMFACLVAALMGMKLKGLPVASATMRTVLGVAVGASVTPALIGRIGEMAASIALVPPFIIVIGAIGYPYFRKVCGFDKATSYYAAMPGGLQDMLVFGEEAGGNPRALSLIHATRILLIVSILPLIMIWVFDQDLSDPPGAPVASLPPLELMLMAVLAIVGWKGGARIGLFGATILGPLILTAAASLGGLIHSRPPAEAIYAAQFFIGFGVGVKYVGVTGPELRRVVSAALGYSAILAVLAAIFAEIVVFFGLAHPVEAILAFAPGGQAEMTVLALIAGADLAYVVTIHLSRILIVIIGAPIVGRFLK
jgi:membrane AbrB-like protein